MGGLHKCTGWNMPMLTDSGAYQVFAMGHMSVSKEIKGSRDGWTPTLQSIKEDGARFTSYWDKSTKVLTPEKSIQIQKDLGADIILVFDECTPYNVSKEYTAGSMRRSHRWALRCIDEFKKDGEACKQVLYGIVQGSIYKDLRKESVEFNCKQPYFGIAIGGSLGNNKQMMYETVEYTMSLLNKCEKPIHLLGIGHIKDIFHGVRQGIDTFDCVNPTRIARHGCALVKPDKDKDKEYIDLTKGRYSADVTVIDPYCECPTCKKGDGYSKMYLHYLIKIKENTGGVLITIHTLMEDIRRGIKDDCLDEIEKEYLFIDE